MLTRLHLVLLGLCWAIALSSPTLSASTLPDGVDAKPLPNATAFSDGKVHPLDGYLPSATPLPSEGSEVARLTDYPVLPTAASPDTTSCYLSGYADWAHSSNTITYTRRSNSTSTIEFAMRFDGPTMPHYTIRVNGAYNWIRRVAEGAPGDGAARVKVNVYSDAGGLPGALLYSETFTLPVHGNTSSYTYFPFTTSVLVNSLYHIGFRVDPAGPSTDTVVFTSDDAGYPGGTATSSGRASVRTYSDNLWHTAQAALGYSPNFDQLSDWCQFYSSCYTASEIPAPYYLGYLTLPDANWSDGSTLNGAAQRFVSVTPESLMTVSLYHWDRGGYNPASTNGLIVSVYPDSAGSIKYSDGPLASVTLSGGIDLFPNTHLSGNGGLNTVSVDFSSFHLVMLGAYHVAVQTTSDNPADGVFAMGMTYEVPGPYYTDGTGASVNYSSPGSPWQRTGNSASWVAAGGTETAFNVRLGVCRDEFSQCENPKTYQQDANQLYTLPTAIAAHITGGVATRIEKIRFQVSPNVGSPTITAKIWTDGGAAGPRTEVFSAVVPVVTYYPGWTEVTIPGGVQVAMDFFAGYENSSPDPANNNFFFCGERDRGTAVDGGAWYYSPADGVWKRMSSTSGHQDNAVIEVQYCRIPEICCLCGPYGNFPTAGGDFGRTGQSSTELRDAACDLSLKWTYHSPAVLSGTGDPEADRIEYTAPIIYEDRVVVAFAGSYRIFDLATGALLHTISGSGAPNFIAATGIQSTPTIANVPASGVPKPLLFVAGGLTNSISAYDLSDPAFPQVWAITGATPGYSSIGSTQFSNFVVSGSGSTLYWTDNNGAVYASDAATGAKVWGPVTLSSSPLGGLAFDGSSLYLSTIASPPASPDGDIYALDATTGTIRWQLSSSGGYKGASLYGPSSFTGETFPSGIATYSGDVFAVASCANSPVYPADGILYCVNAYDGSVRFASKAPHVGNSGGTQRQANVLIHSGKLVVAGGSAWPISPEGGNFIAYNQFTGAQIYAAGAGKTGTPNAYLANGLITCERYDQDMVILFDSYGSLRFRRLSDGKELFTRRIDYTGASGFGSASNRGAGVALSKYGDLVVSTHLGGVYCLTKQEARPRLEPLDFRPGIHTEGAAPSAMVTVPKVFANTGCAQLTGTLHFSDLSNGSLPGLSSNSIATSAAALADVITAPARSFKMRPVFMAEEISAAEMRATAHRTATSVPPWLNSPSSMPFTLAPGDTADITLDINQELIGRGPNALYVQFESNDPDYFLNDGSLQPEIRIEITGGCGIDTTQLHFGSSGANLQVVSNTGRLGSGNWQPTGGGPGNFTFDAFKTGLYQGTYILAASPRRVALSTRGWVPGSNEDNAWLSLLPDRNQCSNDCKPALLAGVSLGNISTDGQTYTPLTGSMVCRQYIDSVLMYDASGAWNWTDFDNAYFDNDSTMGLIVQSRLFGALNAPATFSQLNNVTIDAMKIFPRYGQPVPNWKMLFLADCDIVNPDTAALDAHISTAWAYGLPGSSTGRVIGAIKLPFGNGERAPYTPIKNVRALDCDQSLYPPSTGSSPAFLDSLYAWASLPSGATSQGALTGTRDQGFLATIAEHSFSGSDTLELAVALFGLSSVTAPKDSANYAGLATLLNKWIGFDRGDVNNDGALDLADIVYLADNIGGSGPGPVPFAHLGDVNADGMTNLADVMYLVNYYFHHGPFPRGKFIQH